MLFTSCCCVNVGQRDLCRNIGHGAGPETPEGYLQDFYGQEDRVCCQLHHLLSPGCSRSEAVGGTGTSNTVCPEALRAGKCRNSYPVFSWRRAGALMGSGVGLALGEVGPALVQSSPCVRPRTGTQCSVRQLATWITLQRLEKCNNIWSWAWGKNWKQTWAFSSHCSYSHVPLMLDMGLPAHWGGIWKLSVEHLLSRSFSPTLFAAALDEEWILCWPEENTVSASFHKLHELLSHLHSLWATLLLNPAAIK